MKVCIANLLTVLGGRYLPNQKLWAITQKVMFIISPDYPRSDYPSVQDLTNDLHTKGRNLDSDSVKDFIERDFADIRKSTQSLLDLISPKSYQELLQLMKFWLDSDDEIKSTDETFMYPRLTKEDAIKADLSVVDYLANFILLIARLNDNSQPTKIAISDFKPILERTEKIIGVDSMVEPSALKTIKDSEFDAVFHEVIPPISLSTKKPNDLRLYHVRLNEDTFSYAALISFLRGNIGRYVFDRAKRDEYIQKDKIESLNLDAMSYIKGSGISPDDLGDLLLYTFLESVLKAPKILSSYELSKTHSEKSKAIHLLKRKETSGKSFYQLVFGVSSIEEGLDTAIEKTAHVLNEIISHKDNNIQLIEGLDFSKTFSIDDAQVLKSILIPTKAGNPGPGIALGAFIGYKVNADTSVCDSPDEYKKAIELQMEKDISSKTDFIHSILKKYGLDRHSIYLYFLPFNDPETDKGTIIDSLVSGGF